MDLFAPDGGAVACGDVGQCMLWKIYFWMLCVVAILVSIGIALELLGLAERHPIYPLADYPILAVNLVQLVGLYGFAYKRPLLSGRFWQLAFPVFGLNLAATILIAAIRFAADGEFHIISALIAVSLFGLPVMLPLLVANRRYAFRRPEIWHGSLSH